MSVRAKFKCDLVEEVPDNESKTIQLSAVVHGSGENKEFFRWTPGGTIRINCANLAAAEQFVPGKEFYVDFSPAD